MNLTGEQSKNFWDKVDKTGDCWLWTAGAAHNGYGVFGVNGKNKKAHRISWELKNGPIPEGQCVLHKCDVPACINPDHLFTGTQLENIADRDAKGRQVSRCGEASGRATLNSTSVRQIRELHASGYFTNASLSRLYKVSKMQIGNVVMRRVWRHVA